MGFMTGACKAPLRSFRAVAGTPRDGGQGVGYGPGCGVRVRARSRSSLGPAAPRARPPGSGPLPSSERRGVARERGSLPMGLELRGGASRARRGAARGWAQSPRQQWSQRTARPHATHHDGAECDLVHPCGLA